MPKEWDRFLEETFSLKEYEGKNKVVDLAEAINRCVKPGMTLYLGEKCNALISELIRQFYGKKPEFTVIMLFVTEQALNLVHCGLVKKLITASCTEFFPSSGPTPIIRDAFKNKTLEIENWSLCTLNQRLLAGAMDLPFIPTRSIGGSSMARENTETFCQISDPFGGDQTVNLMKGLKPDIALIHGWAADPAGNTIVAPSVISGEHSHGAKAAKDGVIVSAEQIVSTEFIRQHSVLVSIPAGVVSVVSLVPLGAHPQSVGSDYGVKAFSTYAEDYDFTKSRRDASKDPLEMDKWIKAWVLDIPTHDAYLQKLGRGKISSLRERAGRKGWRAHLDPRSISYSPEYNSREMMVIAAARKTKEMVLRNQYDGLLCGVGTSGLPGWVAYYELRKTNYDLNLWIGSGVYGFSPCPGDPQLFSPPTIKSARMLCDGLNAYGIFVGGNHRAKYMSILSAAQVDRYGNLNSTRISGTSYLIGAGGGNDAANANEVLVLIPQSLRRFVSEVSYITCPGENMTVLISDMGIFEKEAGEFVLTGVLPNPKMLHREEIVEEIRRNCGWRLKISPKLDAMSPPTLEELVTLRALDPEGHFIGGKETG